MLINVTREYGRRLSEAAVTQGIDATRAFVTIRGETKEVKVYDDCFGKWYVFAEAIGPWAAIRAGSFSDAYDIFIDEFLPGETPEDDADAELGYWTGSGKWISEVSGSYITALTPEKLVIEFKRGAE